MSITLGFTKFAQRSFQGCVRPLVSYLLIYLIIGSPSSSNCRPISIPPFSKPYFQRILGLIFGLIFTWTRLHQTLKSLRTIKQNNSFPHFPMNLHRYRGSIILDDNWNVHQSCHLQKNIVNRNEFLRFPICNPLEIIIFVFFWIVILDVCLDTTKH